MTGIAIDKLSSAERLALIGELWDSLEERAVVVTAEQREELDRRLANPALAPEHSKSWEEIKAGLKSGTS